MLLFGKGYVIIQIEGVALSAFLRQLDKQGVFVTNVHYTDATTVRFAILKKDVAKLIPIRRRYRSKIRIVSRHGIPFLWRTLWKRPVLLVGGALMLLVVWWASQRIWCIQTSGATALQQQELTVLLEEHELYVGCKPKEDALITASDDLTAQLTDAAWVALNRNGIFLTVTVCPIQKQTEETESFARSHVVAEKEGVVLSIFVRRGTALCKMGDVVQSGDVLISGAVDYGENRTPFSVAAEGTVVAAVVYRAECPLSETLVEYRLTGEQEKAAALLLGDKRLFETDCSYSHGVTEWEEPVSISTLGIPLFIQRGTAYAFSEQEVSLNRERAVGLAKKQAETQALAGVDRNARIVNIHTFVQTKQGREIAVCIVTAEEEIGISKEF